MNIDWNLFMEKGPLWMFFIFILGGIPYFAPRVATWVEVIVDKFIAYRKERDTEFLKDKQQERERYDELLDQLSKRHILELEQGRKDRQDLEQRMERKMESMFHMISSEFTKAITDNAKAISELSKGIKRIYLVAIANYTTMTGRPKERLFDEMRNISGENISKDGDFEESNGH
jgi:hypothetical protein